MGSGRDSTCWDLPTPLAPPGSIDFPPEAFRPRAQRELLEHPCTRSRAFLPSDLERATYSISDELRRWLGDHDPDVSNHLREGTGIGDHRHASGEHCLREREAEPLVAGCLHVDGGSSGEVV